ncbi:hypothetical protein [Microbulbifer yueqingensis]|uniref:Lysozyme inhibitor LprI N-terminal domain-containing protein n=1 Tax=Microbulbifer yueqingensis TaxID=658219 RepID=A0A1G8ZH45_9GAMM|nr:hypothetical protein [Microbulbifer yueqingensis]SDK14381.1 hypothetical protein SAMN05216212_1624 [Microbulbifer yueqingensis]
MLAVIAALLLGTIAADARGAAARVSCGNVSGFAIENLVCQDEELTRLDRLLRKLMDDVVGERAPGQPAGKRLQERAGKWRARRHQCWRAQNPRQCVVELYRRSIAELQVEVALAGTSRVVHYLCRDQVLTLRFHDTSVPALTVDFRGREVFMLRDRDSAANRYSGPSLSVSIQPGLLLLHRSGRNESSLKCQPSSQQGSETGRRTDFAQCSNRP